MRCSIAAAALAALALATPAAAQVAPPAPTSYFFACNGVNKVQNFETVSWGTAAPTASFQGGAGCGSADPGLLTTTQGTPAGTASVDFIGNGVHTGPINAINVELHSLLLSQARVPADIGGEWELVIDGEQVLLDETQRIAGTVSSTGLTEKYVFSFSKKKVGGVAQPLAAGDGEHTVQVRFSSRFLDYQHAWVWGATEVPAGVTINPTTLASPKIVG